MNQNADTARKATIWASITGGIVAGIITIVIQTWGWVLQINNLVTTVSNLDARTQGVEERLDRLEEFQRKDFEQTQRLRADVQAIAAWLEGEFDVKSKRLEEEPPQQPPIRRERNPDANP